MVKNSTIKANLKLINNKKLSKMFTTKKLLIKFPISNHIMKVNKSLNCFRNILNKIRLSTENKRNKENCV